MFLPSYNLQAAVTVSIIIRPQNKATDVLRLDIFLASARGGCFVCDCASLKITYWAILKVDLRKLDWLLLLI